MIFIENISKEDVIKMIDSNYQNLSGTLKFVNYMEEAIFPDLEKLKINKPLFLVSSKTKNNILGVYDEKRSKFYTYIFKF